MFSLDPASGSETVLYSFCAQQNCADGAAPLANLINVDGVLYGTTLIGGITGCSTNEGCGTVFSFEPGTGAEQVVYAFCSQQSCADGAYPEAALIAVNNMLYGTTEGGGAWGDGTVFALTPDR